MYQERAVGYEKFKSLRGGVYVVEGGIGAGKSTLVSSLEKYLNEIGISSKCYPEYFNKTLLDQFLSDQKKYAYSFQLFLLGRRIEIYKEAILFSKTGGVAIIDRSLPGDIAFMEMHKTNGNISNDESFTYYSVLTADLQLAPSKIVYLKCSSNSLIDRIKTRGHQSEVNGYTVEYLEDYHQHFTTAIEKYSPNNFITVDWEEDKEFENQQLKNDDVIKFLEVLL